MTRPAPPGRACHLVTVPLSAFPLRRSPLPGAANDFTYAIALKLKFAVVYVSRGLIRLRQGRDHEAAEDFKKAVELDSQLKSAIEREASRIRLQRKSLP